MNGGEAADGVAAGRDGELMAEAIAAGDTVRRTTSPNPWVGAVVQATDGTRYSGATQPPGGDHAEVRALAAAGSAAAGATLAVTLEPCAHHGRTPPCADAIITAGVARVVIGVRDPDPSAGGGIAALEAAGIEVRAGVASDGVSDQLAAYLHHRCTGRPLVTLKLAATLDGRTAAADGSSRWITGPEARADVHRLRAEADAVLVGAGTVRADDPELTVRLEDAGTSGVPETGEVARAGAGDLRQPQRIVLGTAPPGARVHPCRELAGELDDVLDTLGDDGVLGLLVEGGAGVAGAFHRNGLVGRYVVYLAPALVGGDDGAPLMSGAGAATVGDLWRGRIRRVTPVGGDLRLDLDPDRASAGG